MAKRWTVQVGLCLICLLASRGSAAAGHELAPPVRLTADHVIIDTGPNWGHSGPCVEDVDGDGLQDLVVGDFGDGFNIYINVGSAKEPAFKDAGLLQAGDGPADVRIYCCIGAQPRFVDLDGDGVRDFISNSYDPGHCYLFRGLADRKFAKGQEIVDKAGVPVRSAPHQRQNFESFGSFYAPVDWDADGDVDLLIGCFDGELILRLNQGDTRHYVFAAENVSVHAGGEPLKVSAHCCPVAADWDGDGLWDVVVGADDGSVTWFRNVGKSGAPELAKGVTLVEKHDGNGYNLLYWSEKDVRPGIRAQVEVTDFNADGKLDLLVGDFYTAFDFKPDLSPTQQDEVRALIKESKEIGKPFRQKMEQLRKDFEARYPGDESYSDEATKEWTRVYKALSESPEAKQMESREADFARRIRPMLAKTHGNGDRSFDLAVPHGFLWLYLRK